MALNNTVILSWLENSDRNYTFILNDSEIERDQMKPTVCSCCPRRFNYFWNWSFSRKFIWFRKRVQRCIIRFWWVITFCSTEHVHFQRDVILSSLRRMFFTTLIWFRNLYKISNSCWFCIHHFCIMGSL